MRRLRAMAKIQVEAAARAGSKVPARRQIATITSWAISSASAAARAARAS